MTTCPVGYYGQSSTNTCEQCQQGCVSCESDSTTCDSCTTYQNVNYYFYENKCVTICPNGTYGDPISLTCLPCIYFSY